ncbi:MAG: cysteine--tRNA ligase, partial [Novosphingobium sp.]
EFLRLQLLIDKGYHPLAYRMLCLQAHYRSELEFSWEGLGAALVRLKRLVMAIDVLKSRHAELVSASNVPSPPLASDEKWTLKQVQGDDEIMAGFGSQVAGIDETISDDLNTAVTLVTLEMILSVKGAPPVSTLRFVDAVDALLGLDLLTLTRVDLRIRPKAATITEPEIEAILTQRKEARVAKDFATSDRLRDGLAAQGVEVMDGDPLGWDWKLEA